MLTGGGDMGPTFGPFDISDELRVLPIFGGIPGGIIPGGRLGIRCMGNGGGIM